MYPIIVNLTFFNIFSSQFKKFSWYVKFYGTIAKKGKLKNQMKP